MTNIQVTALPFELTASQPDVWQAGPDGELTAKAEARTDLFIDPAGQAETLNAPWLLGVAPDADFQFSAKLTVDFAGTYDAGALLLWVDERRWAKLCFEYSPDREPMIVSVVTRGESDDSNGFTVEGNTVWLRVTRSGPAYAFHASLDGKRWHFTRFFSIHDQPVRARLGFEAQSPMGSGCAVTFAEVRFSHDPLHDLRDGS
jgi:regulation of enolase protein 1 (concanavalin A-like superfamily)